MLALEGRELFRMSSCSKFIEERHGRQATKIIEATQITGNNFLPEPIKRL